MVKLFFVFYDDFKVCLKWCLGFEDLVCDVLYEIYLRVDWLDDVLEVKKF